MKEIILIKNGELALKGLNRSNFEDALVKNMRRRLKNLGDFTIRKAQSTIYFEPQSEDFDFEEALSRISRVFGIAAFSRACVCEKTPEAIYAAAREYLPEKMEGARTFKVEAKRSDKRFPMTSPEISREVGAVIIDTMRGIKVDIHNPDVTVRVEGRDEYAYVHAGQVKAAGGIASLEDAEDFMALGADRLGTSRVVKIIKQTDTGSGY